MTPSHAFRLVAAWALVAAVAVPVARASDFTAGDLFLYSPAVTGSSSVDGALVRIDPLTGNATLLVDFFATQSNPGSLAYDPYREGLIFCARLDSVLQPTHLWLVDGAGNRTDLGHEGLNFSTLAPTPFGHVYLRQGGLPGDLIRYLDEFNGLHTLLDDTGTAPFDLAPGAAATIQAMTYHAGTHALIVASGSNQAPPCGGGGGVTAAVSIRRIPLSPDGTQVTGAVNCAEIEISTSGEVPTQWSAGPGGSLLLVVDTNSNAAEGRMVLVDPVTLALSTYASNGSYTGAAATSAGSYSSVLGKAVILDTFANVLRAYAQGESGNGVTITPSIPISSAGGTGEVATLVEVPGGGCDGQYTPYGVGLAGLAGFVPTLQATNCPVIGKAITLEIDDVRGGALGALFIGTTPASLPFKGGLLLVAPILVTLDLQVGGAVGQPATGALSIQVVLPNDPLWVGLSIHCQAGFADAAAVKGASLTPGMQIDVG